MAQAIVTLGPVVNTQSDKLLYGQPDWSIVNTGTNASIACVLAAVTNVQHFCTELDVSFATAPSSGGVMTVKDGTTVIWQASFGVGSGQFFHIDFARPLRATNSASLTATVDAAGSSVAGTVTMIGFSSVSITSFT